MKTHHLSPRIWLRSLKNSLFRSASSIPIDFLPFGGGSGRITLSGRSHSLGLGGLEGYSAMASQLVRTSWSPAVAAKTPRGSAKIVIGDQYSHVTTEKDEVFRSLRQQFSHLHPSFFFMRGRFGGSSARSRFATTTNFITERGRFPTGLLDDIIGEVRSSKLFDQV